MAISIGLPKRPSGVASIRAFPLSLPSRPGRAIGVSTKPGWMEFTRIWSFAYWIAADRCPSSAERVFRL